MTANPVRWAILGTGGIGRTFADDLSNVDGSELVAVGSTTSGRGEAFADEVGASLGGSYEDAVAQDVDLVYVANNHNDHLDAALLAIEAGHGVLVEKPLAVTTTEAAALFSRARERGVFAMEAMWTRFLPHIAAARTALADGAIGTVRHARLALGRDQRGRYPRIFDPARAGGALLDLGVYPVAIARMLLGPVDEVVEAEARIEGGVDLETTATLRCGDVTVAVAMAADRHLDSSLVLEGRKGRLVIPDPLHHADRIELHTGSEVEVVRAPIDGHGFEYEIREVHACVTDGRLESSSWSPADTLGTHEVLDEVRRRVGLVYPFEDGPPPIL